MPTATPRDPHVHSQQSDVMTWAISIGAQGYINSQVLLRRFQEGLRTNILTLMVNVNIWSGIYRTPLGYLGRLA